MRSPALAVAISAPAGLHLDERGLDDRGRHVSAAYIDDDLVARADVTVALLLMHEGSFVRPHRGTFTQDPGAALTVRTPSARRGSAVEVHGVDAGGAHEG